MHDFSFQRGRGCPVGGQVVSALTPCSVTGFLLYMCLYMFVQLYIYVYVNIHIYIYWQYWHIYIIYTNIAESHYGRIDIDVYCIYVSLEVTGGHWMCCTRSNSQFNFSENGVFCLDRGRDGIFLASLGLLRDDIL